jgi:hypothetical protein
MRYIIVIALLLASCTTQRKVKAWMHVNEPKAAVICNDMFPVIETHDTTYLHDTTYQVEVRNTTEYIEREVLLGCDTITATKVIERIRTMPAAPAQTKVVTRTVESTAKISIIERQLKAARNERSLLMWLLIAALLYILYRLLKDRYHAKN